MADISKITLTDGTTYDLKDARARELITALESATDFLGVTTTELTDGATTSSVVIQGETKTAVSGNIVSYGKAEFIFNGTVWQEFGDLSALGKLAFQGNAKADYTPSGTISQPETTVQTTKKTIGQLTNVGTLPTFQVSEETLVLTAGTLPTKSNVEVISSVDGATTTKPVFTGTKSTITVS